nr:hypothetical protein [Tanacetum cinerariifolium]
MHHRHHSYSRHITTTITFIPISKTSPTSCIHHSHHLHATTTVVHLPPSPRLPPYLRTNIITPLPSSSPYAKKGVFGVIKHHSFLEFEFLFGLQKLYLLDLSEMCFNANHDDCIKKFLKKVNSRAKVQSPKTRNINKAVEPKSHTQKPDRQIAIGQRFSLNKSFAMCEKLNTPRSCHRWIPTCRIFKTTGLRWIPTGNMFIDSTTKVDSEPPNGLNGDITNPYECKQSLDVSAASDLNVKKMASADNTSGPALQRKERCTLQCALSLEDEKSPCLIPLSSTSFMLFHSHSVIKNGPMTPGYISLGLMKNSFSLTPYVPPSKKDYEILLQQLFDEYFNPPPRVVFLVLVVVDAPRAVDPAGLLSLTTIDQDVPSASSSPTTQEIQSQVTHQGAEEQIHRHQNAQFDNAPLLYNLSSDLSFEETTLQGFIPSNLHYLNQSFDTLTMLTMNHLLENVICDPS